MDLAEAIKKASEILDEELAVPTVDYRATNVTLERSLQELSGVRKNLIAQRESRPRTVEEVKGYYAFSSTNFGLLTAVLGQVPKQDRNAFVSALVKRVPSRSSYRRDAHSYAYPRFSAHISELPLLTEFFIRTGYLTLLLQEAAKMTRPTYGLLLLLMQLEEAIALNFRIFTDEQLESMPDMLLNLHEEMFVLTYKLTRPRGATGPGEKNPRYVPGFEALAAEVMRSIDGIREECRKAHYFYLKGELQGTVNLEIENDKTKVVGFLEKLGFSAPLIGLLDSAEKLYRDRTNPFNLKHCLDSLRTILEKLHIEAHESVAAAAAQATWDVSTAFLRKNAFIAEKQEKFARGLHGLLSHEGSHAVIAGEEFARLCRNMVIEYGLMFLTALDKKGIRLSHPASTSPGTSASARGV